jgi:hypothetical protein
MSYNVLRRNCAAWFERGPTICTSMLYKQAFTKVHIDGFVDVLQRAPKKLRGMVQEGPDNLHRLFYTMKISSQCKLSGSHYQLQRLTKRSAWSADKLHQRSYTKPKMVRIASIKTVGISFAKKIHKVPLQTSVSLLLLGTSIVHASLICLRVLELLLEPLMNPPLTCPF